jgi:hypothetical protein
MGAEPLHLFAEIYCNGLLFETLHCSGECCVTCGGNGARESEQHLQLHPQVVIVQFERSVFNRQTGRQTIRVCFGGTSCLTNISARVASNIRGDRRATIRFPGNGITRILECELSGFGIGWNGRPVRACAVNCQFAGKLPVPFRTTTHDAHAGEENREVFHTRTLTYRKAKHQVQDHFILFQLKLALEIWGEIWVFFGGDDRAREVQASRLAGLVAPR